MYCRNLVGFSLSVTSTRESLLKGKDQYGWPPGPSKFFYYYYYLLLLLLFITIIIIYLLLLIIILCFYYWTYIFFFFTKTSYINKEVNCTYPNPSLRILCFYPSLIFASMARFLPLRWSPIRGSTLVSTYLPSNIRPGPNVI